MTHFGAARAANAATQCVLGVVDGSRDLILAPKLARIGARVGLHEARITNPFSSIVDGVPMGRIDAAGPAVRPDDR